MTRKTAVFTGSRNWKDEARIEKALVALGITEVAHGACPCRDENCRSRGPGWTCTPECKGTVSADAIVDKVARRLGITVRCYPADWQKHGRAAGPIRNRNMLLKEMPDVVVAFPEPNGKGTQDCIRQSLELNRDVVVDLEEQSEDPLPG